MKTVKQVRKEMKGFLGSKAVNPKKTKSARRKNIRKDIWKAIP